MTKTAKDEDDLGTRVTITNEVSRETRDFYTETSRDKVETFSTETKVNPKATRNLRLTSQAELCQQEWLRS